MDSVFLNADDDSVFLNADDDSEGYAEVSFSIEDVAEEITSLIGKEKAAKISDKDMEVILIDAEDDMTDVMISNGSMILNQYVREYLSQKGYLK